MEPRRYFKHFTVEGLVQLGLLVVAFLTLILGGIGYWNRTESWRVLHDAKVGEIVQKLDKSADTLHKVVDNVNDTNLILRTWNEHGKIIRMDMPEKVRNGDSNVAIDKSH